MLFHASVQKQRIYCVIVAFFFIFFGFDGAMQYLVALYTREGIAHLAFNSQIILYITFAISNIFSSKLIKPFGLKYSMIVGVLLYFLYIFSLLSKNALFIYPSAFLIGIGAALLWVSSRQLITINSSKETLGKYLSMQFSSFMFGTLSGAVLGALLISNVSFTFLYAIFAGAIALSIPILLVSQPEREILMTVKFDPRYLFKKHILLLSLLIFSSTFISSQTQNGMNIVILSRFGLQATGTVAIILKITIVAASLAIGILTVRTSKAKILSVLIFFGLLGVLLFLLSSSMFALACSVLLIGLFISSTQTQVLSVMRIIVHAEEYVLAIGAVQVYQCLGILVAIASVKYLTPVQSFLPGLVTLALSLPLLFLFKKKYL